MTTNQLGVEWAEAQEALRDMVGRLTAMLRTIAVSDRPCLGDWGPAEVAMHLSQAWVVVPGLARRDLSGAYEILPGMAGAAGESLIGDIRELSETTKLGVRTDPERNLAVLADRIDERAATFFSESLGTSPGEERAWLVEGTTVSRLGLVCHLLNETVVHGYDIARAAGVPWKIERRYAAMVLGGFIVPVMQALDPRAMVDQQKAAGVHATYDLRLRGGDQVFFVFDDGAMHVEAPSDRRVDCHLSADPAALLLVGWGRKSQWSAIAKGQLVAWGRKPWLGPRFGPLIRTL